MRPRCVVGLSACARSARRDAEVPGTYVYVRGPARDTLVLRPGGRWDRRFAVAGRRVLHDSGSWRSLAIDGERLLKVEGLDVRVGLDARPRAGASWLVEPERSWFGLGRTRLPVSDDTDEYFVRVAGHPAPTDDEQMSNQAWWRTTRVRG